MPRKVECPPGYAHCTRCGFRPVDEFLPRGGGRSGYQSYCKTCSAEKQRERLGTKPKLPAPPEGMARCSRCSTVKSLDAFPCNRNTRSGRGSWCSACVSSYQYFESEERRKRNLENAAAWDKEHRRHPRVLKYEAPNEPVSSVDAAWIAGFVDAEGSFGMAQCVYAPRIHVYNNERQALDFIAAKLGGAVTEMRSRPGQFVLTMTSLSSVAHACEVLAPYLVIKREQCEITKAMCAAAVSERQAMYEKVMALNRTVDNVEGVHIVGRKTELAWATPEQWAYLAGYLEGDGSFTLQRQTFGRTTYYYAWVTVYSKRLAGPSWMNDIFGGTLKFRKRDNKWHPCGELKFADEAYVKQILNGLMPHLKYRQAEAQLLLDALANDSDCRQDFKDRMMAMHVSARVVTPDTVDADGDPVKVEQSSA